MPLPRLLVAAMTAAAAMLTLASRGEPNPPATGSSAAPFIGHVHGLGVDPADQVLYVAAHGGLLRLVDSRLQLVADRAHRTPWGSPWSDHATS